MIDLRTSINSFGLVLTIGGVVTIYLNSPLNFFGIDGGSPDTDFSAIEKATLRRNALMKVGTLLVVLGTVLQLASNYGPPG